MAQLQHNMWGDPVEISGSVGLTGGGKWVELTIAADALYQHVLLVAEKKIPGSASPRASVRPSLGSRHPGPASSRSASST